MITVVKYSEYLLSGIYKITNKITGHFYIGSAVCFRTRFNSHVSKLNKGNHHNKHLNNAWNKYGKEVFEFSVIEICEKPLLYIREQYYIDTLKPAYNKQLKAGVWRGNSSSKKGGFKKGYKPSAETLLKKAQAKLRRNEEGLKNKERPHSDITRNKMSRSHQMRLSNPTFDLKAIIDKLNNGVSLKEISDTTGISRSMISHIKTGRRWKHLTNSLLLHKLST